MNKSDLIQQAIGFQEEINRLIMEHRTEEWLSLDLTIAQLKSTIYIYSKGKVKFKELAGALGVTPSVVTGIVDRLVLQGMVKRKLEGSSTDRRVQWLIVTDKGKAVLDNIRQESIKEISQILEVLSYEDLSALVRGFSALVKAAEPYLENRNKARGTAADRVNRYSLSATYLNQEEF